MRTRVINYEGSKYSSEFWTPEREYEDRAERIALQALLPPRGRRLIEIGAGAGRLGGLYLGYDEIVLMDYAHSTLVEAHAHWGHDARFKFVAADVYRLPFADGAFDAIVMVRVLHHLVDVSRALTQIAATLQTNGTFVLEFANKRNLKAMLRYALRRQSWSPYTREPIEFVELNFDFHPAWVETKLRDAAFEVYHKRAVSFFRVGMLKRLFGAKRLAAIDGALQRPLAWSTIAPSVFVECGLRRGEQRPALNGLFKCPECSSLEWNESEGTLMCAQGHRWEKKQGVYDFRAINK